MSNHRIALVTGGTGGLGTAICLSLANSGYRVLANYHPGFENQALEWHERNNAAGHSFDIIGADVSAPDQCKEMIKSAISQYGSVDCLVNNAGVTRDSQFKKMQLDQWKTVISTNLDSMYNVTRPVIEGMLANSFGRIINISSVSGQAGNFGQTNYAAAKAGVHGFTMALAREVARHGVTVNSISPGYIATEMVSAMREDVIAGIVDQIPVGRMGEPAEIGRAVAFLASEDASYITGSDLSVNGGLYM